MNRITLFIIFLFGLFSGFLQAQQVEPSVATYLVAELVGGEAKLLPPAPEQQLWESQLVQRAFPAGSKGQLQHIANEVLEHADLGWIYQSLWQKGDHLLRLRYPIWNQQGTLVLPEVGEYSACWCEGCTILEFVPNKAGCLCEGDANCSYLLGSQLH